MSFIELVQITTVSTTTIVEIITKTGMNYIALNFSSVIQSRLRYFLIRTRADNVWTSQISFTTMLVS